VKEGSGEGASHAVDYFVGSSGALREGYVDG